MLANKFGLATGEGALTGLGKAALSGSTFNTTIVNGSKRRR
jgi:hypothetical protein